jgi:histidine decarboxylase
MTKNKFRMYPSNNPQYIGSIDSTLSGSRNGMSSIALWKYINSKSEV